MPDKKTLILIVITAVIVLAVAPRLRALPIVSKIPTL